MHRYSTYSNEVGGYASPYAYSASATSQQAMGYDISADYVDSTTTYEPRSSIIDSDFIGGHSKNYFTFVVIRKTNHIIIGKKLLTKCHEKNKYMFGIFALVFSY